jgi:signal transduction histidine kinase
MQYLDYVQGDIGAPPDYARAAELSRILPVTIQIAGPEGTWSSNGRPIDLGGVEFVQQGHKAGKEYAFGKLQGRDYLRVQDGAYTYAYTIPVERGTIRIVVPLLVLLLVLILLYHATRRLFAPVQTIKAGVERIGRGDLDHRLTVRRCDELGDLAASINAMADDVQQMLDSKRQLLLAISHELRSPLTRARVATSLVDDEPQRQEIERELNDLEKLIEELLETERLASRHQALSKQHMDMTVLVRDVVDNIRAEREPVLRLASESIEADVDPIRIKLLLRNLLENAERHTPQGAPPPEVYLGHAGPAERYDRADPLATPDFIELTVTDYGPGIPAEHLPHVTEPFYRVDPARQRETGGYGLGLYLCRRIAEVHGGSLTVTGAPHGGTVVHVRLPAL